MDDLIMKRDELQRAVNRLILRIDDIQEEQTERKQQFVKIDNSKHLMNDKKSLFEH